MKSFLRFFINSRARFDLKPALNDNSTDANYEKALRQMGSVAPMPEALVSSWSSLKQLSSLTAEASIKCQYAGRVASLSDT